MSEGTKYVRSPRFPSSKFSPPRAFAELVHRSRLLDELDQGAPARLTLVVASPGSGKTTLLTDWLTSHPERRSAWVSCDPADDDPVRFFAALIEACRRATDSPSLGEDALQLLTLDGEVSADVVAALADDLEGADELRLLVIDDFHLTGPTGADALRLLVDCQPPGLQMVVASRVDPALRLQRMRVSHELVELRDDDLSFSPEETRSFLDGLGVQLGETELTVIHQRSEGWAAGLQMAAISIQHSSDARESITGLELQRHTVAGYFLEEVLSHQPAELADFMLATSILDELSVPASTALYGQRASALLQQLSASHLFVTRVDDESGTYRYHQLIRDVLQAELRRRDPPREQQLHATAGRYLADAGRVGPAVSHLLAAGDPAGAFQLLSERIVLDFASTPVLGSALDLADIQPEAFAGNPAILVPLAAELQLRGAFERGRRALDLARKTGVDADQQPELAVQLALVTAIHLAFTGQFAESLAHREWAFRLAPPSSSADLWHLALDVTGMYCHVFLGELEKARQLIETVEAARVTPPVTEVLCPGVKSQAAMMEGALARANNLAAAALDSADKLHFESHYFAFTALRTASLLALERRDLGTAASLNERILGIVAGGRPAFEFFAQLDRARIWAAQGNIEEALSSLPQARAALRSDRSVLFAQADEIEARLRLSLGDRQGARDLTERLPDDRRAVVSAIVALADGDAAGAGEALINVPAATTIRSDLELRLLRSTMATLQGSPQASRLVRNALDLAVEHGFIQTVLDTTPLIVDQLVAESARFRDSDNFRALVAAAFEVREKNGHGSNPGRLPDPLTEAELRVLASLAQRLTYADIATELHLSLNTVKTHLRHSYMKLGVSSRTTAIRRAISLGVI